MTALGLVLFLVSLMVVPRPARALCDTDANGDCINYSDAPTGDSGQATGSVSPFDACLNDGNTNSYCTCTVTIGNPIDQCNGANPEGVTGSTGGTGNGGAVGGGSGTGATGAAATGLGAGTGVTGSSGTGSSGLSGTTGSSGTGASAASGGTFHISNPLKVNSVSDLVQTGAQIFTYIVVLIGVIALIWTGLQYILAQGNSEKIKELHKQLLWLVVGIGIVIGARIIVSVVINTLSSTGAVDSNIINNANSALHGN